MIACVSVQKDTNYTLSNKTSYANPNMMGGAQTPAVQSKPVAGKVVVPPPAETVGGAATPKPKLDMPKYGW